MAPEKLYKWKRGEKFQYDAFAADMWAFGVTLYMLITKQSLLKSNLTSEIKEEIWNFKFTEDN